MKSIKFKKILLSLLPIFVLCLASCHSISQKIYSQNTKEDKILYFKKQGKLYPDDPIDIFKNNKLIATIKLGDDKHTLKIIYSKGSVYKLWKYYDYSGIDKITQSKDENIIRIYYWESVIAGLFQTKDYVTEFYIDSKDKRTFRLKK